MEIKITIPGEPFVKKNGARHSMFYKSKTGAKVPREHPVTYYSEPYKEWAKKAIIACGDFKTKHHSEYEFPLQGKYNLKCLFFIGKDKKVDLSNLMEGIQDVLAGNPGIDIADKSYYQILEDDSVRYIGSLDGSRVIYIPGQEPRIELTLSNFNWAFNNILPESGLIKNDISEPNPSPNT